MRRLWDILVGLTMITLSLIIQVFCVGLLAGFAAAGLLSYLGREWSPWVMLALLGAMLAVLNGIACYEYFRGRQVAGVSERAGQIFMLPRGLDRIVRGQEYVPTDLAASGSGTQLGTARVPPMPSFVGAFACLAASVGGFAWGLTTRHDAGSIVMGLALILLLVSPFLLGHGLLAWLGVLRRSERSQTGGSHS